MSDAEQHDAEASTTKTSEAATALSLSTDYRAWIDRLALTHREFAYRYVYDAYLVAQDRDIGLYFQAEAVPDAEGEAIVLRHRVRRPGDEDLLLSSQPERRVFLAYLEERFARGRGMAAWHDKEHTNFLEDRWWVD